MSNNIVVYTSIMGGYDNLNESQLKIPNVDYICFTDDRSIKSNIWDITYVKQSELDANRSAKIYKILPHKFLPSQYEKSVWIDGNFDVVGDFRELFELNSNHLVFDHNKTKDDKRNCIYDELTACIRLRKDNIDVMSNQVDRYKVDGYPEQNGLVSNAVLIRNHNEEDVKFVMEKWWNEIKNNSKRDQLSFNYIAWKYNYDFKYLEGMIRDNKYFKKRGWHRK